MNIFGKKTEPVVEEQLVTAASVKSGTSRVTLYDDDMKMVEVTLLRSVTIEGFMVRGLDEFGLVRIFYVPYFKIEELP